MLNNWRLFVYLTARRIGMNFILYAEGVKDKMDVATIRQQLADLSTKVDNAAAREAADAANAGANLQPISDDITAIAAKVDALNTTAA